MARLFVPHYYVSDDEVAGNEPMDLDRLDVRMRSD
jgi:hypothetical protein